MWTEMKRLNEALLAEMHVHAGLCAATRPDVPALARARWQVAQASRRRLEHLLDVAFPVARRHATGDVALRMQRLWDTTPAYRRTISEFLARWPAEALAADWEGYQREVPKIRALVKTRLSDEAAIMQMLSWVPATAGDGAPYLSPLGDRLSPATLPDSATFG